MGGHLSPDPGWVPSFIGTCSDLAARVQGHTAGLGLSCGCGHNRDDEARFSTGPSQPPRYLDWHRTGRCGSGHRLLQRRRCSTGSPQPTGQQRAQGLGEVRAACMEWPRAAEHQHRVRQTAPPLDLGSRKQLSRTLQSWLSASNVFTAIQAEHFNGWTPDPDAIRCRHRADTPSLPFWGGFLLRLELQWEC